MLDIWGVLMSFCNSVLKVHHLREEFKNLEVIRDGFKKQTRKKLFNIGLKIYYWISFIYSKFYPSESTL